MSRSAGRLVAAIAFSVSMYAATAADAAQPSIIEACTRTVNDYAWYLDHPASDPAQTAKTFADLFTEDARLTVPDDDLSDQTHVGHKAIAKHYVDNNRHTRFLHVTSNIRVTPTSDKTATGTSYASFRFHLDTGSMKDEGAIWGVAEFRDEYRITAKGCKFSRRTSTLRLLNLIGIIEPPEPE